MTETSQRRLGDVAVLGLGRTGESVARFFLAQMPERVSSVTVFGGPASAPSEKTQALEEAGATVVCGTDEVLGSFDLAVASPGIPEDSDFFASARAHAAEVIGEPELAWRESPERWVAITGTNGKTTTTSLATHLLQASGLAAESVGNIGTPPTEAIASRGDDTWFVAELSSFQLYWAREFMCDLAIVTNLAPDHIDWHGSYENYVASKANLINCLAPGGAAIYQKRDEEALHIKDGVERFPLTWHEDDPHAQGIYLDEQVGAAWINGGGCRMKHRLFLFGDVKLLGRHNLENAAMAAGALAIFNTPEITPELMGSYVPPKHRCAFAGKLRGVTFVDDSKGTNVAASITAMTSLPGTKVVPAGIGSVKNRLLFSSVPVLVTVLV